MKIRPLLIEDAIRRGLQLRTSGQIFLAVIEWARALLQLDKETGVFASIEAATRVQLRPVVFVLANMLLIAQITFVVLLFGWSWLLIACWEYILSVITSPWWRIAAVTILFGTGFFLYMLRTLMRPIYGLAEIIFGITVCWASFSYPSSKTFATSLAICGGVYILVRGFDNVIDDKSITDPPTATDMTTATDVPTA